MFKVQVKGISKQWGFFLQKSFFRAKPQRNLYLVVVIVARQPLQDKSTAFRFFVLSYGDAKKEGKDMPTPYHGRSAGHSSTDDTCKILDLCPGAAARFAGGSIQLTQHD